jgi:hypothetical protein
MGAQMGAGPPISGLGYWILQTVWIVGWTVVGAISLVFVFWLVFLAVTVGVWLKEKLLHGPRGRKR